MDSTSKKDAGATAIAANTLCQQCGICCDGTLFATVTAHEEERDDSGPEIHKNETGKFFFDQPCSKFTDRTCSIYAARPTSCRLFQCQLQKNIMNGSQSLEEGVDIVSGVKLSAEELTDWAKQNSNKDLKAISLCGFLDWYQNKALRDNRPWQMPLSDRDNVLKAFEWLKIVDRYFVPSRTLARFADLIQKFSSEEKRPLSDRIKGFFFNSSQD